MLPADATVTIVVAVTLPFRETFPPFNVTVDTGPLPRLGTEFLVNTVTAGTQQWESVAGLSNGAKMRDPYPIGAETRFKRGGTRRCGLIKPSTSKTCIG